MKDKSFRLWLLVAAATVLTVVTVLTAASAGHLK